MRSPGYDFDIKDMADPGSDLWIRVLSRFIEEISVESTSLALRSVIRSNHVKEEISRLSVGNPANMSVLEAARYLRISINTLYKWTSQGKIPHRKIGSKKLGFNQDELDQFLASRRVADEIEIKERATRAVGRMRL
jgi:excisionase family DNA binding protein